MHESAFGTKPIQKWMLHFQRLSDGQRNFERWWVTKQWEGFGVSGPPSVRAIARWHH